MLNAAKTWLGALIIACGVSTVARAEEPALTDIGKKHFIRCVACHSVDANARPMLGPHLAGIVGRKVAAVEGFKYTDALRAQTWVWDEAQLDKLLERPQNLLPGLCMPFMGLPKPEHRQALIAYLKNPAP